MFKKPIFFLESCSNLFILFTGSSLQPLKKNITEPWPASNGAPRSRDLWMVTDRAAKYQCVFVAIERNRKGTSQDGGSELPARESFASDWWVIFLLHAVLIKRKNTLSLNITCLQARYTVFFWKVCWNIWWHVVLLFTADFRYCDINYFSKCINRATMVRSKNNLKFFYYFVLLKYG